MFRQIAELDQTADFAADSAFPRQLVESLRDGDQKSDQKIVSILVVIGSWMNATAGTMWSMGPIADGMYSERIGVGIASRSGDSFTPLIAICEEIVAEGHNDSTRLDMVQSLAEFDQRNA
ncbi:hypothetical protein [Corynebacterium sp. H130]|uniref:hypothetical protein n=1 Tax=Corynebacterium sp. H130 TaxID=3133444 RepID=UPI003094D301